MSPDPKSRGRSKKVSKPKKTKKTPKDRTPTAAPPTVTQAGPTMQRLDQGGIRPGGGMDRMPSNAPTMAIAPSDYEHIFHEGQAPAADNERAVSPSPPPTPASPPTPTPPPSPPPQPSPSPLRQAPTMNDYSGPAEVQVTPDGYTLLGQPPLSMSSVQRRQALPSHIVRASNQFSRAALLRIARYLAGRMDNY